MNRYISINSNFLLFDYTQPKVFFNPFHASAVFAPMMKVCFFFVVVFFVFFFKMANLFPPI